MKIFRWNQIRIFNAYVQVILLNATESWFVSNSIIQKFQVYGKMFEPNKINTTWISWTLRTRILDTYTHIVCRCILKTFEIWIRKLQVKIKYQGTRIRLLFMSVSALLFIVSIEPIGQKLSTYSTGCHVAFSCFWWFL